MDFLQAFRSVCGAFDAQRLRYALIGGFAMALRGVQRATVDLDFILMLEDLDRADAILRAAGYRRGFHSGNVSHYSASDAMLGRIDILHAFRGPTLGMLQRAERIQVADGIDLPVVQIEDIIGLKVQAAVNDPRRALADWADIQLLVAAAAQIGQGLDWGLIGDYLDIFDLTCELPRIRSWYGPPDPSRT